MRHLPPVKSKGSCHLMDLLHRHRCHPRLLFQRGSMCVLSFVHYLRPFFVYLDFLALLEPERSDHVSKAPRCSVYPGSLCPSHFWVASKKRKHASFAHIPGTRLLRPSHCFGSIFQDIFLTWGGDLFAKGTLFLGIPTTVAQWTTWRLGVI
jgi:hypothetical protein